MNPMPIVHHARRLFINQTGGNDPIALCVSRKMAFAIRDALNELSSVKQERA